MTTIIRDILQDLERTRENMLALSDDIWLSMDLQHVGGNSSSYGFVRQLSYKHQNSASENLKRKTP